MMYFETLELPDFLKESLNKMGIATATPVQESAIPVGLEGRDILASAQTGTGKTLAYLLPIITRLINSSADTALILTPTRELAAQVKDTLEKLLYKQRCYSTALLIGGDPMRKQLDSLRRSPRFIVGTPGRINDHIARGSLKLPLSCARFLVFDEADRMLDMGFIDDIEKIVRKLPSERQTLMFSATLPGNIIQLSQKYMVNPERISLGSSTQPTAQVNQQTIQTTVSDKFPRLLKELEAREGSIIVFVKTKMGAENLAGKLKRENMSVEAIHGDLRQRQRDQAIRAFRDQKKRILVATDIAARGLDVHHVRHVVNYDPPECAETYIHRIGRTGRAGLEGHALSFILPEDRRRWRAIDAFINRKSGTSSTEEFPQFPQRRPQPTNYRKPKVGAWTRSPRSDANARSGFSAGASSGRGGFASRSGANTARTGFSADAGGPSGRSGFASRSGANTARTGFSADAGGPSGRSGFASRSGANTARTGFSAGAGGPSGRGGFAGRSGANTARTGFSADAGGGPSGRGGFGGRSGANTARTGFSADAGGGPSGRSGFASRSGANTARTGFSAGAGGPSGRGGFAGRSGANTARTGFSADAGGPSGRSGFASRRGGSNAVRNGDAPPRSGAPRLGNSFSASAPHKRSASPRKSRQFET
jgi:ATP-dependent RNA helicase DeaD